VTGILVDPKMQQRKYSIVQETVREVSTYIYLFPNLKFIKGISEII